MRRKKTKVIEDKENVVKGTKRKEKKKEGNLKIMIVPICLRRMSQIHPQLSSLRSFFGSNKKNIFPSDLYVIIMIYHLIQTLVRMQNRYVIR